MKRGWIAWDRDELPPAALARRLEQVRALLSERSLPALLVYTDVWRSNHARYFSNFMPYWNRALLVIPRDGAPILLCALSSRVYPWIRSTSILDDVRPGPLVEGLLKLCAEKSWTRIGALDLASLPHDLHARLLAADFQVEDVTVSRPCLPDDAEISMRRRAVALARHVLETELPAGAGKRDWDLVGRLERELRRGEAEDAVILVSRGDSAPRPASGQLLAEIYSAVLALEYRGHWVRVSRPHAPAPLLDEVRRQFQAALSDPPALSAARLENLSSAYPWELGPFSRLATGDLFALHVEHGSDRRRLFYADTCLVTETGIELL